VTQEEKKKKSEPGDFRMSFTGHLEELRRRLLICVIALLAGMAVSYAFRDELFAFILHPLFVAREAVDGTVTGADADTWPRTALELSRNAQKLSKQALVEEDSERAVKLAAKAAGVAAKAVEAVERGEEIREERERLRRQRSIAYTNPVKPFWVSLQLALVGGICLSFGIILFQIWAFIAPGLYPREKRYAIPFVVAATGCFLSGAGFGYRFVFPVGFGFLTRFSREIALAQGIDMMDVTTVDAFVSIALKLLLAFGVVFELPVVISFLALAGIVDHKQLWRFGRYFIVISVIIGAMLTPPDIISQVMMAVPMAVLYLISIGLAYILHPSRRKAREESKAKKKKTKATKEGEATEGEAEDPPPEEPAG
jgi:sec-independent protein translocase protein TatC